MSTNDMDGDVLIVGATGTLGNEVLSLIGAAGHRTRAVIRPDAAASDTALGETAPGDGRKTAQRAIAERTAYVTTAADLTDPRSLERACEGATAVVSTATALLSQRPHDTLQSVDHQGQLALIDAAERAGVKHFCFVSFLATPFESELQSAKRAVEERLAKSRLSYTVIQATAFMEVWLSPAMGFSPATGHARIFGSGQAPVSWVSLHDVARFAAASLDRPRFANQVIELGGPDALNPLQVVDIFEELGCPAVSKEFVPEAALLQQYKAAPDPRAKAFAAAALTTAQGQVVNPERAQALLPGRLRTVRDFAATILNRTSVAP